MPPARRLRRRTRATARCRPAGPRPPRPRPRPRPAPAAGPRHCRPRRRRVRPPPRSPGHLPRSGAAPTPAGPGRRFCHQSPEVRARRGVFDSDGKLSRAASRRCAAEERGVPTEPNDTELGRVAGAVPRRARRAVGRRASRRGRTQHFAPEQIVSSDHLRAVVGEGEEDLAASTDAFALLEQIVAHRLRRRLTTVVDTLGLDPERRAAWLDARPPARLSRRVRRLRDHRGRVPGPQPRRRQVGPRPCPRRGRCAQLAQQRDALDAEGFDIVLEPAVVRTAPRSVAAATARRAPSRPRHRSGCGSGCRSRCTRGRAARPRSRTRLRGDRRRGRGGRLLEHLGDGPLPPDPDVRTGVAGHARELHDARVPRRRHRTGAARHARHRHHLPQRRPPREDRRDARRALAAAGRCAGSGSAGTRKSTRAYGWPFPPVDERYALLEDALQCLPLLWGKGTPAFEGRALDVPGSLCYPRPLQEHVPILVGGNGERRTLRLAAQYADACNIIGEADVVRRKVAVLHAHCDDVGRDRAAVEVTQLSTTLVGRDAARGRDARRAAAAAAPRRRAVRDERERRHRRRPDRPVPRPGRCRRADGDRQPPRPAALAGRRSGPGGPVRPGHRRVRLKELPGPRGMGSVCDRLRYIVSYRDRPRYGIYDRSKPNEQGPTQVRSDQDHDLRLGRRTRVGRRRRAPENARTHA